MNPQPARPPRRQAHEPDQPTCCWAGVSCCWRCGCGGAGLMRMPVFAIRGITVQGDVTHNNAVTLRANVAPQLQRHFLHGGPGAARQALRVRALGAPGGGAARVPEPAARASCRSTRPWPTGARRASRTLVNSYGEVFEANLGEVEQDELPRLNGPEGQAAQVLAMYRDAAAAVRAAGPADRAAGADRRAAAGAPARHRRRDRTGPRHAPTR